MIGNKFLRNFNTAHILRSADSANLAYFFRSLLSTASMEAPASRRRSTTGTWPPDAAQWMGWEPSSFRAGISTGALHSMKNLTTWLWPPSAAQWRGVCPSRSYWCNTPTPSRSTISINHFYLKIYYSQVTYFGNNEKSRLYFFVDRYFGSDCLFKGDEKYRKGPNFARK